MVCKRCCWLLTSLNIVSQISFVFPGFYHIHKDESSLLHPAGDHLTQPLPLFSWLGYDAMSEVPLMYWHDVGHGAFLLRPAADTCLFWVPPCLFPSPPYSFSTSISPGCLSPHIWPPSKYLLALPLLLLPWVYVSLLVFWKKEMIRVWREDRRWCFYVPAGGEFSPPKEPGGNEWWSCPFWRGGVTQQGFPCPLPLELPKLQSVPLKMCSIPN